MAKPSFHHTQYGQKSQLYFQLLNTCICVYMSCINLIKAISVKVAASQAINVQVKRQAAAHSTYNQNKPFLECYGRFKIKEGALGMLAKTIWRAASSRIHQSWPGYHKSSKSLSDLLDALLFERHEY